MISGGGELISCDKSFRDFHRMCLLVSSNRLEQNQSASRISDVPRNKMA